MIFSYLSVILDLFANIPYAWSVYKGQIRPHPFTWLIWTLLVLLMAVIQYNGGAGGGGWLLISTTILNIIIVILSFRFGTKDIQRSDYIALFFCLACFPLYFLFKLPDIAAIIITTIDCVSFYPMLRKSFHDPHGESALFQGIMASAYLSSLVAMDAYSLSTALFPVSMVIMHGSSCLYLLVLRHKIAS